MKAMRRVLKTVRRVKVNSMVTPQYERRLASNREWKNRNKDKVREKQKIYDDLNRFGGLRQSVLERDNYSCVKCKLTRKEHYNRFNRDITIDHIDKNRKNNTLDNLQTLCVPCHNEKDNRETRIKKGMQLAKGRKNTEEQRKIISQNHAHYWKGKKRSPETAKKISDTLKLRWSSK